jgi:uncharacterized protein (TIGR02145 family)
MKKFKIVLCVVMLLTCWSWNLKAQVGIGTKTPHASALLDLSSTSKGLLPPRMTETQMNAISSPATGLMVYCTNCSTAGIKIYNGSAWGDVTTSTNSSTTVSVNCNVNGFSGFYTNGVAMTASNKFSVTITNNSFNSVSISFQTSDLVLSGITGITVSSVSIPSVTLNVGQSQLVEYTLSGTPTLSGTLSGIWTKFALNCVKTVDVINPSIASINCSGTHYGALTSGAAASGVSSVLTYNGGNGAAHNGQIVTSTGVTGLTATLVAGTFATGTGSLTYNITGTPSGTGTASFIIYIGGRTCTLQRTVISIPNTITLAQNRMYFVTSIFDQDYLPYTVPTSVATSNVQAADGVNEITTVNVQGFVSTGGVQVIIPVTATGSGTLPAYSTTITIPSSMTEDGNSRNLILSWAAQSYTAVTKSITATIASVFSTLNTKKLDINSGVGSDALGVLIGQFNYPFNNAGNLTTFSIRNIAGIPDKMFGLPDNNSNNTTHLMLYAPILAEDGKLWLNNNLGADRANINKSSFNPGRQDGYEAYGSFFQWGRKPDGHELINWSSSTTGTPLNSTTNTRVDNPSHALFIITNFTDWRNTLDSTIWKTATSPNNPCPAGYRVPTLTELNVLISAADITNIYMANNSILKLPASGYRNGHISTSGNLSSIGNTGLYYTSSSNSSSAGSSYIYELSSTSTSSFLINNANGASVRCIKD